MRKGLSKKQRKLMNTCAWCQKNIPDNIEVFGMGAKIRQGINLKQKEGQFLKLSLMDDRTIHAFVATDGSKAKENGYDLMFMACSEECAKDMRNALQEGIDFIGEINKIGWH